ncbi:MAG: hypothetical protein WDO73_04460 [Ignavibacteriota bacterium]
MNNPEFGCGLFNLVFEPEQHHSGRRFGVHGGRGAHSLVGRQAAGGRRE